MGGFIARRALNNLQSVTQIFRRDFTRPANRAAAAACLNVRGAARFEGNREVIVPVDDRLIKTNNCRFTAYKRKYLSGTRCEIGRRAAPRRANI